MMESSVKRFAPFAAVLGVVGLLAAAVIWLLQRQFNSYVQASLAVALLGFALALLFNPGALMTWAGGRQARYGTNVLTMLVALLGILILANYLVVRNPKQWDWSEGQVNTLAPETLNVLKGLSQPVKAVGFYSTQFQSAQGTAKSLLDRYKTAANGKFSYEFHDPLGDPTLARQYNVTRDGTLIVEMGSNREELSFASEQELTGALVRLSNPGKRVLYFLTGHGERDIAATDNNGMSKVADLLKKQNYDLQPLNLQVTTTVPSDARAVVVAGPLVPVTPDEVNIIKTYVDGGGKLLVMSDSLIQTQTPVSATEPLADYLKSGWGIDLGRDVVVDLYNSYPQQPLFPLNSGYGDSPITSRLQKISTVFPLARSVGAPKTPDANQNITVTPLITVDARAWGETNFESLSGSSGPQLDSADVQPGLNIAVSAENTTSKGRVVVFGDSDFASNAFADQGADGNLFVNAVNWVTVEESLINLTPKASTTRSLALTDALTVNLIFLVTVIVMPLTVLVIGGVVWFQRRRHI